jgi:hypothetical protein
MIAPIWIKIDVGSVAANCASYCCGFVSIPLLARYGRTKTAGLSKIKITLRNQSASAIQTFHGGSLGVGRGAIGSADKGTLVGGTCSSVSTSEVYRIRRGRTKVSNFQP